MGDAGTRPAFVHPLSSTAWWVVHVASILLVARANRRFTLFQDDFLFLDQARFAPLAAGRYPDQGLTIEYLGRDLFGHFSPVARLLFWVLGRTGDFQVGAYLMVLGLFSAAVFATGYLLKTILGRSAEAAALLLAVCGGLVLVRLTSWTTASFNMLPAFALGALCLAWAFTFLRGTGGRRYAVASVAAFAAAQLDYELAILLPVIVGTWWLAVRWPELGVRQGLRELRSHLGYWLALAAVGLAAAVNYATNYATPLTHPSTAEILATVRHSLLQGLFPASFGVFQPDHGVSALGAAALVLWALVIGVAARHRGARVLGCICVAMVAWLMSVLVLAWGRAAINGVYVGIDLFYAVVPLLGLLVGVAEGIRLPPREPGPIHATRRRAVLLAVAVLASLSVVGTQLQAARATDANRTQATTREAASNFERGLDRYGAAATVVSGPVDNLIVWPQLAPYNDFQRSLGVLWPAVRWNSDGSNLLRVTPSGELVPVDFEPAGSADVARAVAKAGARPKGDGRCWVMRTSRSHIDVPYRGQPPATPAVTVRAWVSQTTALEPKVIHTQRSSVAATSARTTWVQGEVGAVFMPPVESVESFRFIGLRPGTTLCLDSLEVGSLVDR
jgi:hypothetical protein